MNKKNRFSCKGQANMREIDYQCVLKISFQYADLTDDRTIYICARGGMSSTTSSSCPGYASEEFGKRSTAFTRDEVAKTALSDILHGSQCAPTLDTP